MLDSRAADPGRTVPDTEPSTAPALPLGPGTRLGPYELREALGRGGMGIVYRARHTRLHADVAVKVLRAGEDASAEAIARFRREAQSAAALRHPGIVAVHDIDEARGVLYLAMDFVDGQGLDRRIAAAGAGLPVREAVTIVAEAAEAIQHAHGRGVVHRDLKPANLMIDRSGQVRIMDFGLARTAAPDEARMTREGQLVGTPAYMSPEQAWGRNEAVGPASDVYQLGAILYEAVTGRRPYDGATAMAVVLNVQRAAPPPPGTHRRDLPREVETICLRAMAREPEGRYASAGAFAADCRRWLAGEAIEARRDRPWEAAWRWARRRKAAAAFLVVMLVAGAAAAGDAWRAKALEREVLDGLRSVAAAQVASARAVRRSGTPLAETAAGFLAPLEEAVRRAEARSAGGAEPRWHLGRLRRALLQFAAAVAEQDRALERDPGFAPARYERAVANTALLAEGLTHGYERWTVAARVASTFGGGRAPAPPTRAELTAADPALAALREAIAADLSHLQALAGRSGASGLSPADLRCARGLFLLHAGRAEDRVQTDALLDEVLAQEPDREEARLGRAQSRFEAGELAAAAELLAEGVARDRGHAPFRLLRGNALLFEGQARAGRGEDPSACFEGARDEFEALVRLDPASPAGVARRAHALAALASYRALRGEPAAELFDAAMADFGTALGREPRSARLWMMRALIGHQRAVFRADAPDAAAGFESALADAARAVEHGWEAVDGRSCSAWMRMTRARLPETPPADRERLLAAALADADAAVAAAPARPECLLLRASVRSAEAAAARARGASPEDATAAALADLRRAAELDPSDARPWRALGQEHLERATAARRTGNDPAPALEAAFEAFHSAAALEPASVEAWVGAARARLELARLPAGGFVASEAAIAADLLARLCASFPRSADAAFARAELLAELAAAPAAEGDVDPRLAAAIEAYQGAVELAPGRASGWSALAALRGRKALLEISRGEDALPEVLATIDAWGHAIDLLPSDPQSWMKRGTCRATAAALLRARGQDARVAAEEALADLDRAVERGPEHGAMWLARAQVRGGCAQAAALEGRERADLFAGADEDWGRAIERLGRRTELVDGQTRLRLGRALALGLLGRDPRPACLAASEAAADSLRESPDRATPHLLRGHARVVAAAWEATHGVDPEENLRAAQLDFEAAGTDPGSALEVHLGLGNVHFWTGLDSLLHGGDPALAFDRSAAEYSAARALAPAAALPRVRLATVHAVWTRWRRMTGAPGVDEGFRGAEAEATDALELDPTFAEAWLVRGAIRADWAASGTRGPEAWKRTDEALADLDRAIELAPASSDAWTWRGRLHTLRGRWPAAAASETAREWEAATADLERACTLAPEVAEPRVEAARLFLLRATRAAPRPAPAFLGRAHELLDAALERDPASARAFWYRARVRQALGRHDEANADSTRAHEIHPRAAAAFTALDD